MEFINGGPYDLAELTREFAELPLTTLAPAWVGAVIDSVMTAIDSDDLVIANLTRALTVVADRLHQVEFDSPVRGVQPGPTSGVPAMAESMTSPSGPTLDSDGFEIRRGTPPPKPRRGARYDPLFEQIKALKAGEHLVVSKKRVKIGTTLRNKIKRAIEAGAPRSLTCYSAEGDVWVVLVAPVPPSGRVAT